MKDVLGIYPGHLLLGGKIQNKPQMHTESYCAAAKISILRLSKADVSVLKEVTKGVAWCYL